LLTTHIDTGDALLLPNTPADDHWTLRIASTNLNALTPNYTFITFLPNGTIDTSRTPQSDIENVNALLSPAVSALKAQLTQSVDFDILSLLNWVFVSFYWTFLFDLGQTTPTLLHVDTVYSSTNNIFVNETLFEIYSSYLRNTVVPILAATVSFSGSPLPPTFSNISSENFAQPEERTFDLTYACSRRKIKPTLSFIISVIVADYTFIVGGYRFVIAVAAMVQRRRRRGEVPNRYS
jgi:hypothetical protein